MYVERHHLRPRPSAHPLDFYSLQPTNSKRTLSYHDQRMKLTF